jgi:hypothetical protein
MYFLPPLAPGAVILKGFEEPGRERVSESKNGVPMI